MWECRNTWVRLSAYNWILNAMTCRMSLGVETRMQIHWPLLSPPRRRVYLESSLLRTCVEQMKSRRTWFESIKLEWVRAGWILKIIHYLKRNQKLRKYEERLFSSGYLRITNCTSAPILDCICYVYIPKLQSYCSRNCMKEFVGIT